ncbi:LysR family transcriptional regulator [Herbaspirillum rubrisubalbicans]|uniref:LysR family transcriptional regulator n=1 Tax=Herbaspirillum rubrisubalbicans TaxID=80842 RepID=A0AAD0XHM7_9BURK|nr:LysR family transcriptional regulator [Herbaspirillum rubrisubalbicans]AYR25657.1 LysR family transcriptional regulator [Herbaspirillum rubrisubalbicans]
MSPSIDLRLLRYFIAVAEEGHLTKAAERIGIQQPPLSQQIRLLERELGVTLFNRLPRGMELTDSGTALLTDARALLAQLDTTVASVRRIAQGKMGRIAVGFTESASLHPFVHSVIRAFRADAPDVVMTVEESNTNELIEALRAKRLDLAFVRSPVGDASGLTIETMLVEEMVAALPIDHPLAEHGKRKSIALHALAEQAFIMTRRPNGPGLYDTIIAACHAAGFSPQVTQEARKNLSTLSLVAAGVGVAVIPASMTRVNAEGVVYLKLTGAPELKAPLHLAYRTGSISGAARLMREEALKLSAGRKRR